MGAHLDRIRAEPVAQTLVHRIDRRGGDDTVADVRLISDDYDPITRTAHRLDRFGRAGEQPELLQPAHRIGFPVHDRRADEDAVPVEENRWPHETVTDMRERRTPAARPRVWCRRQLQHLIH